MDDAAVVRMELKDLFDGAAGLGNSWAGFLPFLGPLDDGADVDEPMPDRKRGRQSEEPGFGGIDPQVAGLMDEAW